MFVLQGAKKREKCPFRFEKLYVSFLRLYFEITIVRSNAY